MRTSPRARWSHPGQPGPRSGGRQIRRDGILTAGGELDRARAAPADFRTIPASAGSSGGDPASADPRGHGAAGGKRGGTLCGPGNSLAGRSGRGARAGRSDPGRRCGRSACSSSGSWPATEKASRAARAILAAQANRAARLTVADDVLVNSGTVAELRQAVDRLHQRYLRACRSDALRSLTALRRDLTQIQGLPWASCWLTIGG